MAEDGQVIGVHKVEEFKEIVNNEKNSGKLIVVDFTASWCPPCRFISPHFAELAKKNVNAIFLKVDVDELKEISEQYEVTAMPTFVFLKGGEEVRRFVGAEKDKLTAIVHELNRAATTSTA